MADGIEFYIVKAMAIVTTGILFFAVLIFVSMGISKIFPDDTTESIGQTTLMFTGQLAVFYLAYWAARVYLKQFPRLFEGKAGFQSDRLKEA